MRLQPLAALAAFPLALLSRCTDGELEPVSGWESVSGCADGGFVADGGAVAVETGLAAEGNPLAYGDEDDGFRCDEIDKNCVQKCFDGPSDTCTCEEDIENEDWCCCFGEPGCDFCTGGGGECGGGEGEGEGEGSEEEGEGEEEGKGIWGGGALRLNCFDTDCGMRGGCEVRTCKVSGSLNVHDLNSACGDSVALGTFKDLVEAHEHEHQNSLNECVRTVNRFGHYGRLGAIEAIVASRDLAE